MPQFNAPLWVPTPVGDINSSSRHPGDLASAQVTGAVDIEEQLDEVIRSARGIAASAEELLRELSLEQQVLRTGRGALRPLVVEQSFCFLGVMRDRLQRALDGLPID